MRSQDYFYNCSREYILNIDKQLYTEVTTIIENLIKRNTQAEINRDLLISFSSKDWSFDSAPKDLEHLKKRNTRSLCTTSSTLNARWHCDFAKVYDSSLVQLEVQFGTVESMFKDFCGFRIAYYEKRISLGIEIVMSEPNKYFAQRKESISGMAYFEIAKQTLPAIGLNCPIWLVGIYE